MAILFFFFCIDNTYGEKERKKVSIKTYRNDIFNTFKGMSPNAQVIFIYIKKGRSDGFSSHPENSFCDVSINIHASVNQKSKAGGCKEEESLFGFWKNCNSGNTNLGNPESVLKKR